MVFSSVVFLFYFLPIFLAAYIVLRPLRAFVIVLGSLVFYGWGEPARTSLLVAFILFNWQVGRLIGAGRSRAWLILGCTGDTALLLYFKYKAWLLGQASAALAALGMLPWHVPPTDLPLGISFFTFQGLSYLIDISRGVVRPQGSLLKFAMYKSMFPQLIAGPIVRYSEIANEIDDRRLDAERGARGVQAFVTGLAQKVLIANTVAPAANAIFRLSPAEMTMATAWLGAACYMVQIYFDFAGYSNMAIGLGHMLGFSLPRNFDNPYAARSMTEFWRRWHMTLSAWFRDYLYIPLGGSRRGTLRTYRNLLITFVLCGLWHGAAWTFAFWGLYHGAFLIAERLVGNLRVPAALRHVYVLLAVLVGWVFFRAETIGDAGRMLAVMGGLGDASPTAWPVGRFASNSVLVALTVAVVIVVAPALPLAERPAPWREAASVASLLLMFLLSAIAISSGAYNPFIYFRF